MDPPSDDRRSQRRVEAAIPIYVRGLDAAGNEYDHATHAVEVSRRGLSFLTPCCLAVFAPLTIIIPGRGPVRDSEGATDFFVEATVVRCVKEDKDSYRIGVRFRGATLPMYSSERT